MEMVGPKFSPWSLWVLVSKPSCFRIEEWSAASFWLVWFPNPLAAGSQMGTLCSFWYISFCSRSPSAAGFDNGTDRTMHCLILSLRSEGSWTSSQKYFLQQFSTKNFYGLSLNVNVLFLCIFSASEVRVVSMSMSTIVSWVQHPSQAYNRHLTLWTSKVIKYSSFALFVVGQGRRFCQIRVRIESGEE